jgi:hypothetical protein
MISIKRGSMKKMHTFGGSLALILIIAGLLPVPSAMAQKRYRVAVSPISAAGVSINSVVTNYVMVNPGDSFDLAYVAPNPLYYFSAWKLGSTNITLDPGTYGADYTNEAAYLGDQGISVRIVSTGEVNTILATAIFSNNMFKLVASASPTNGGTVSIVGTNGAFTAFTNTYFNGTSNTITATEQAGYKFINWSGDASGDANPLAVVMSGNRTVIANFSNTWNISQAFVNGPSELFTNVSPQLLNGTQTNISVAKLTEETSTQRSRCDGWAGGTGSINPTNQSGPAYNSVNITVKTNTFLAWNWKTQFKVSISPNSNGVTTVIGHDLESPVWVDANETIVAHMAAIGNYAPEKCVVMPGGEVYFPDDAGNVNLTSVTNALTIYPYYVAIVGTDPGYQAFLKYFGLPTSASGAMAPGEDPDKDGLSNFREYQLSNTNNGSYYSPINADTDGDGMDDFYEAYSVNPTNLTDQVKASKDYYPAGCDDGSISVDNGPSGNPDHDYHWSTTDGYMQPSQPLVNLEEYEGSDGVRPWTFLTVSTNSAFPIVTNGVSILVHPLGATGTRPNVAVRIPYVGPAGEVDSDDQSKGNTANSDRDNFDDGYEYSWDQWQHWGRTNVTWSGDSTNEVYLIGVTNQVPIYYTNAIPAWTPSTRIFKPNRVDSLIGGGPDYDVLYDYKTGKVSADYYTADREYGAWQANAFSPGIGAAPHTIVIDGSAPSIDPALAAAGVVTKRCSHPFLWDVDQDGLPDGYEVIFGYDPWFKVTLGHLLADGLDNPDNDWMAKSNPTNAIALRNHEVYLMPAGFDPRVAVDEVYPGANDMPGKGTKASPTTAQYSNREELWGPNGIMTIVPGAENDDATNPFNYDSDGDGIWDGWENYVGLNPNLATDAPLDADGDKISNLIEFQSFYTSSTNRGALIPVADWQNKIFPTDPNGEDTDGDGIKDSAEKPLFNGTSSVQLGGSVTNMVINEDGDLVQQGFAAGVWNGKCYTGGGLNPTSSNTDQDTLPDPYEASYAAGLDGTMGDAFNDPDGDRLKNYQEYYSCAIYHWQYDAWTYGQPSYNSADFFQGKPKAWDWSQARYIPCLSPGPLAYSGCRPTMVDSDSDNMDDYYEIYHGLNPAYGVYDLVASRVEKAIVRVRPVVADYRLYPYVAGTPEADPDGDGLPNIEEAPLWYYQQQSPRYHTDPSPLWMTDTGSASSWVNLYYQPGGFWPWSGKLQQPPYAYDFESNEGFDTDGDGRSDYEELNVTKTDPMSPERPVKRRALYLPLGQAAYARTFPGYVPGVTYPKSGYVPGTSVIGYSGDYLRSFTVEAWVRPLTPSNGMDQVVVERPIMLPSGNPMSLVQGIRLNFRIALNADGYPYASYNGNGTQLIFPEARVTGSAKLSATNWTHIAATYQVPDTINPLVGGVFTLYVDGRIARQDVFRELPANGVFNPNWHIYCAPIVVGAADANPDGVIGAGSAPQPEKFFKGWIDEVRIWDGVRDGTQILAGSKIRMKQADVLASKQSPVSLFYLYSFDALTDPDHSATTTGTGVGFDPTATAIFPSGWTVGFWGSSSQRSQIYSDYRMVPWIQNAAAHTPEIPVTDIGPTNGYVSLMNGTTVVGQYAPFWNSSNPYGYRYYTAPDGVLDFYDVANDLLPLRWAQADEDVPMWDNGTVPATTGFDSDGDGMPDSWEELYGLDPFDPNGVDGAYGDADHDGLANLAEYLAGTSPVTWDSLGMGFSDYDNRANAGSRTFGELYDDGDGMPGSWEALYVPGLDPGKYDADKDPDGDGWSNYAEYMGSWKAYMVMSLSNGVGFVSNTNNAVMVQHCDPLDPDRYPVPLIAFNVKYNGKLGASLNDALTGNWDVRIMVYNTPAMDGYPNATLNLKEDADNDGIPDWWNKRYNVTESAGDPDGDFLSNFDEYRYGMDPYNPDSNGNGIPDGTDYSHSANQSGAIVREFTTGHVREGNNYIFAYLDVNNDMQWQPESEPAGIGQFQPVNLGWSDVNNVEIGLTDSMQGYSRFSWPASTTAKKYIVISTTPALTMEIQAPRNYIHEGDYLKNGSYGFPAGFPSFDVYENDLNHYITTVLAPEIPTSVLGSPSFVTAHDASFSSARNEIEFKVDPNATSYRMQVALSSNGTPILSVENIVPFRDIKGVSKVALPFYAGDNYVPTGGNYPSSVWENGRYWVQVQAANPSASVSSPWSAFNLTNQPPPAKSMIQGDVYYFGKVSHGYGTGMTTNKLTILVQAFESPGFSGVADGQVQITTNCSNSTIGPSIAGNTNNVGNAKKGDFSLMGLMNKVYYVRAFIDVNGNRQLDSWEPVGYARVNAASTDYDLLAVDLKGEVGKLASGVRVIIRDRDTDADKLPDGWEWMYYGTLARGSGDLGVQNMTYWGATNMTLLRCYEVDPVDVDPTAVGGDTDGDGVSDFDEVCYSDRIAGTAPDVNRYDPYPPSATSLGTDLNPMKWDTDGDGLSDGYELAHGLNPLDPGDGAAEIARAMAAGEAIPGLPRVSRIAAVPPEGGQFSLTWQAQNGMNYEVQYSDDLKTWTSALGLGVSSYANGVYTYVDQSPKVTTRFYRVVVK